MKKLAILLLLVIALLTSSCQYITGEAPAQTPKPTPPPTPIRNLILNTSNFGYKDVLSIHCCRTGKYDKMSEASSEEGK